MKELIDGLLLGDGSLAKTCKNARYRHSCKHKEYIEFIIKELQNVEVYIKTVYDKDNGYNTGRVFQCYSLVNSELTFHYERWYHNKKKSLPSDLMLTPLILLHWYIGDGGFDSDKGYLRQISIAAHSFSFEEREILCNKLRNFDLKVSNTKNGKINITKKSIPLFLSIIGECPVKCYQYKFDTSIYNNPQPKYKP
jgi:hypothetical protein